MTPVTLPAKEADVDVKKNRILNLQVVESIIDL